jgi:hypothetical protein
MSLLAWCRNATVRIIVACHKGLILKSHVFLILYTKLKKSTSCYIHYIILDYSKKAQIKNNKRCISPNIVLYLSTVVHDVIFTVGST